MAARLVYDGDCGFCRYTVDYARRVTGDEVEYRPYQEVEGEHPEVSTAEFAGSIQLFVDGVRYQGARAAFLTLALGGRRGWLAVYGVPGLAPLFEWLYGVVSSRREGCYSACRVLFGPSLGPCEHTHTADWLYRGIMFCGLLGFLSFWWQAHGLIGGDGVLPLHEFFPRLLESYGELVILQTPSLFWLSTSNQALHLVCAVGVVATLLGVAGRLRLTAALAAYVCYLSLVHAGQVFMAFQWDILLTECFVLAVLLTRVPTLGVWVGRLLLFRFMLLSGAVKLLSGDATWADGSALDYHFETQPLPTLLAWFAHQLPQWLLRWGVHATLIIELALPFFIFAPRNPRRLAGAAFILLEVLILLTGSYNFFNLLTIVLCVSLLDDRIVGAAEPGAAKRWLRGMSPPAGRRLLSRGVACLLIVQGLVVTQAALQRQPPPGWLNLGSGLLLTNSYGLFAVMTTRRNELVVQGTTDGRRWQAYGFPFKPGPPERAPVLATPHQPRLDWQLWFAVLGQPGNSPWIYDFVFSLLEARPPVLALLDDPFDGQRPQAVRILRYPYRFTSSAERGRSEDWWHRGAPEVWLGPVRLNRPAISHDPLVIDGRGP